LHVPSSIIRVIISRRMRLARHIAGMEAKIHAYNILFGKPEKKRPLARPGRT
jgi:hypothetical protein